MESPIPRIRKPKNNFCSDRQRVKMTKKNNFFISFFFFCFVLYLVAFSLFFFFANKQHILVRKFLKIENNDKKSSRFWKTLYGEYLWNCRTCSIFSPIKEGLQSEFCTESKQVFMSQKTVFFLTLEAQMHLLAKALAVAWNKMDTTLRWHIWLQHFRKKNVRQKVLEKKLLVV